jgi:hypothetical protein
MQDRDVAIAFAATLIALGSGCALLSKSTSPATTPGGTTAVSYQPSATATNIAGTLTTVGGALPQPVGALVEGAGALLMAGLTALAAYKTKAANTSTSMLNAVIAGVESLTTSSPPAATQAKQAIQVAAASRGVAPQLAKTVALQTTPNGTTPPKAT